MKNSFIHILFIILFFSIGCKNTSDKEFNAQDYFEPSYKQKHHQKSKDSIEFLDDKSKIYTNLKYGISVDFPDNWDVDIGTTSNTLVRGIEKDSGIVFTVIPIELKKGTEMYKMQSQHIEFYESNKQEYEKYLVENLIKMTNREIYNFKTKKNHLKGHETIKSTFNQILKDLDFEYEITTIMHQFWKEPYFYTISLNVPTIWYEEDSYKYDWLFTNVYFTK